MMDNELLDFSIPETPEPKSIKTMVMIEQSELTRLRSVEKAQEWLPMETAPKDGTYILLLEKGEVNKARWEQNYAVVCYPDSPYEWCIFGTYGDEQGYFDSVINPEGWRPLPPPPTGGENE
jgi:hypothetical protein